MFYRVLLLSLFFIPNSLLGNVFEYDLQKHKKNSAYDEKYIEIEQCAVNIAKISTKIDSTLNERTIQVDKLLIKAELLWYKFAVDREFEIMHDYLYKKVCEIGINFYILSNQTYKAIDIYKKLIADSKKNDMIGTELESLNKLTNLYLELGQIEFAQSLLKNQKQILDDFFILDYDYILENDCYTLLAYANYTKNLTHAELLSKTNYINKQEIEDFFDLYIKYSRHNYIVNFIDITGWKNSNVSFMTTNKDDVYLKHYYTNYKFMYELAKYFIMTKDIKRARIAQSEFTKALHANSSGSVDTSSIYAKNSIAQKEINKYLLNYGIRILPKSLARIPYLYNYLGSLYNADIENRLNHLTIANSFIIQATEDINTLESIYNTLNKEYEYLDNIEITKKDFLLTTALIDESRKKLDSASKNYSKLIIQNEKIRESLPIKLRKSYFRGYAKDAYLGLIRSRAKIYEKVKTNQSFDDLLKALNLLSSRQLKDLKATVDMKEQNLQELQSSLNKEDLIYIIYDTGSDIVLAGISKNKIFASVIPKNKNLNERLYNIKNDLVKKQFFNKTELLNISKEFINPIAKFKGIKNIHLLIDGIVSILPFDIYPLNKQMLFHNYRIKYLTTLEISNTENKKIKNLQFLAVADPIYDFHITGTILDKKLSKKRSADISGYFVQLPETRREVEVISQKMPNSKLLLGEAAKESTIKSMNLDIYTHIHFATHGILGGEIPDMNEPALVLAKEDKEDSLLSASEISKLKLNASLVVLSACNSGSGKYFRGEGITGIARAFKVAGSKEIIASLWPVDSFATEKLMEYFYDNITKEYSNSEALYLAKQQLLTNSSKEKRAQRGLQKKDIQKNITNGYSNPYFWSAFILIN